MERAIFEDIRFRMLYDGPVVVTSVGKPMQYFELRPGARPPTREDIAAYVERQVPALQLEAAVPLVDAQPSGDALCALDHVNEKLASRPLQIPRMLLSLTGWAYDRAEPGAPPSVRAPDVGRAP